MRIKKKEMVLAVVLCLSITIFAIYLNMRNKEEYLGNYLLEARTLKESYGLSSSTGNQQYSKIYSEIIEGELDRGAFEQVVSTLEVLTENMGGYVKSLYMTYRMKFGAAPWLARFPRQM